MFNLRVLKNPVLGTTKTLNICIIEVQVTAVARPRNQKDYKDAAIRLDGGFLLLRYKEFQFVFAFCTEEFDDQFAAIVTGAVDTFFVFWHFFEFGIQKV